jgi:hypothetical protein
VAVVAVQGLVEMVVQVEVVGEILLLKREVMQF